MIVCVCNRLSDRQIAASIERGAASVGSVFRDHGCRPNCGQCISHIQAAVADARDANVGEPTLAGVFA